jgi:hypothetical protein
MKRKRDLFTKEDGMLQVDKEFYNITNFKNPKSHTNGNKIWLSEQYQQR